MKNYTEYKPSGVEWIGDIPENWNVRRIKYLFKEIDLRSTSEDEELLSVSQYTGVKPKKDCLESENEKITNAESLEGYKRVSKNDLVINIMLAWNGSLGVSDYEGIVSPAYCVYRIIDSNNPKYFDYLFRTDLYKTEFKRNSTGVIDSRLRLYTDKFFNIFSILPPLNEQTTITNYLDSKTAQINTFILKKQRMIELLKEQRTAIINRAVTKGINPNVKMKPSGIDWLDEIPEDWEVKALKYWVMINSSALSEKTDPEYLIEYIDISNVNENGLINPPQEMKFKDAPSRARRIVRKDDVIISTVRTYLKAISKIDSSQENLIVSTGFAVLTPKKEVNSELLNYLIKANYFIEKANSLSYGVNYPAINTSYLGRVDIALPSSIEEQTEIVNYINQENEIINRAIDKAKKEIELIKEFRTALISEVVTGKIDLTENIRSLCITSKPTSIYANE